jgi:hypothetical protein
MHLLIIQAFHSQRQALRHTHDYWYQGNAWPKYISIFKEFYFALSDINDISISFDIVSVWLQQPLQKLDTRSEHQCSCLAELALILLLRKELKQRCRKHHRNSAAISAMAHGSDSRFPSFLSHGCVGMLWPFAHALCPRGVFSKAGTRSPSGMHCDGDDSLVLHFPTQNRK